MRWHTDPTKCSHSNDDVCKTCDFDGYFRSRPVAYRSHDFALRPDSHTGFCEICGEEL